MTPIRLLALSGSLRAGSSNTSLLEAACRLAPRGLQIELYRGMADLPHFNPDLENDLPQGIVDLHARIGAADGLLISCPEYARGIPGSFKNMLDWLVGSSTFPGKPVALFNTSPRASEAQAALRLVLQTMSAHIVDQASLSVDLLSRRMDTTAIAADPAMSSTIVQALGCFADCIRLMQQDA
ncbi:NAD(P)H-dependent FMN reductase [Enhydrobacter aerosaccus]|uniref:NAD(P)H-dependent FMN reductase n=1 Tax=Enhydrobacter aerosaccus TaxID=225324 RepID=A0A1T4MZW6_9HYPH|nr:NADPH-dependent FMN reductase [Enhydrobacter aerosaccus]SJZ72573.1 NAD(P)H-dependent FMN reductase [Enhydrobacter aerosaccus]